MNRDKQFDKKLSDNRRSPRVKLSLSPFSHRSGGTQRFASSVASTNVSKVSYRLPHDSVEIHTPPKASPGKFMFPQFSEKSSNSIKFIPSRKESVHNIQTLEVEPTFKSQRSSSQVQLGSLLQPSSFLPKINKSHRDSLKSHRDSLKSHRDSLDSTDPAHSSQFRRSSGIVATLLNSYENKFKGENDKNDPESFLRKAVKLHIDASKMNLKNKFKLALFGKILKQIILDLVNEKRTFETKILIQGFDFGLSKDGYNQAFFDQRKQLIIKPLEACQKLVMHLKQLQLEFHKKKSKKLIDEEFSKLVPITRESQNSEIHLQILKIWGKICRERKDYHKAEQLFKLHKQMCNIYRAFDSKIRSYKHLGVCAQSKLKHKIALSNFINALTMGRTLYSGRPVVESLICCNCRG